jgi:hypothetical protein
MRAGLRIFLLTLTLLLAACDGVFTPTPLGENPLSLDPVEWQGTWLASDMVVTTTVMDSDKGLLQVAWIERGVGGASLEIIEGSMRFSGDLIFANVRDDNENAGARYLWLMIDKSGNSFTVWSPNLGQFKQAIKSGKLPGKETEDGVVLGELSVEHLDLISNPASNLMDWKNPGVFVRVTD